MSTRTGSHQLSNGLIVSGRPEHQLQTRQPTMASRSTPYTGGDVNKSGELGKMCGGINHHLPKYPPSTASQPNTRSGPNSGPIGPKPTSGPINKKSSSSSFSGPITPIQPTGLITSGPLGSTSAPSSFKKPNCGSSAITSLVGGDVKLGFRVSRVGILACVVVMGLIVAAFVVIAVKKTVVVVLALAAVLVPWAAFGVWNYLYRKRGVLGFLKGYPDAELRGAVDGQFVKVTGVVTCGSIPLETSFQMVPRCVYTSSELYEYRGCGGKPASAKHRFFSWGCRHSERYVADFYISDFQTGLRALVKAGYGANVAPFVKPTVVVDVTKDKKELSPNFLRWLSDRGLSSDDRLMRLKEGHITEGSTVSVMGMVRRQDNVLMIVPPSEPISTGCRWLWCLIPAYIEGLIITCDESQNGEAIPV